MISENYIENLNNALEKVSFYRDVIYRYIKDENNDFYDRLETYFYIDVNLFDTDRDIYTKPFNHIHPTDNNVRDIFDYLCNDARRYQKVSIQQMIKLLFAKYVGLESEDELFLGCEYDLETLLKNAPDSVVIKDNWSKAEYLVTKDMLMKCINIALKDAVLTCIVDW